MTTASPCIFVLPALGVAPGYYAPLAEALRQAMQAEVSVLAQRAPSTWMEKLGGTMRYGYPEMVQDICASVREARAKQPERHVLLLGHSLGGHGALLAAARLGSAVSGIALVACGTPYWGAWPEAGQARFRKLIGYVNLLSRALPWYPGNWVGFGGDQPRRLMRHWCTLARTGVLTNIEGFGHDAPLLQALKLPVLSINVQGDDLAPPGATDHLLAQFPNVERGRQTLDDERTRSLAPSRRHFAWIRQPEPVVRLVQDWAARELL